MELLNCKKCGRTFASEEGQTLCTKCLLINIEDDFRLVRDYLYDHPGADVTEVSAATGVAKAVILKLLKDERIEVISEDNIILRCEVCGKSIKSGRKCEECKLDFAKALMKTAEELKTSKSEGSPSREEKRENRFHSKTR